MQAAYLTVSGVPALLLGEASRRAFLFVHGKMGSKEEARAFAEIACPAGWQVLAVDLPEHGSRREAPERLVPWVAVPELSGVHDWMRHHWDATGVRATSIGAWFALHALRESTAAAALLVSPVVDMEGLIAAMMERSGVSEDDLRHEGEILDPSGEVLSWDYLQWVRAHPLAWSGLKPQEGPASCPENGLGSRSATFVLYPEHDELTPRATVEAFAERTGAELTVVHGAGHWLHTEDDLRHMRAWEARCVAGVSAC